MERELVGLLGAGLTSVATGYGVAVPVGAIDRGFTLIDVLSRESGPRIGATLNGMVQAFWLDWQRSGLDRDTTAVHAGALPAIIELNRPPPEAFAAARNSADSGRLLVVEILDRARHTGDLVRAALDERTAYALLERLFRAIFNERAALPEMMAAVDLYLQSGLWSQGIDATPPAAPPPAAPPPAAAPPVAAPPPKVALLPRLSARAIAALRGIIEARGSKVADASALAAELADGLTALIDRVAALAQRVPDASGSLIAAARQMANGELGEAERSLSAAQETLIQRASSDLSVARQMMHSAAELMAMRATFEELRLDMRKAARHYRGATRCLTSADGTLAHRLLTTQGQVLLRLDRMGGDDGALADAIKAFREAAAIDIPQLSNAQRAREHTRLAELHVELGHRTRNPREYLAAAERALEALRACQGEGAAAVASDAHFVRAQSLWFAADRTSDLGIVDAAAQAFRDTLDHVRRDEHPVRWVAASSLLGQALLRMASLRAEPKLLPSAIEHLRASVQFASTCNVEIDSLQTESALGRALLGEYAAGGQPLLLDLAATAFRRAIKAATANGDTEAKGALQHELGMTLWAMAQRANQNGGFAVAIEGLEHSIASFDSIGATARATAVRADLEKLLAVIHGAGARTGDVVSHGSS